MTGKLRIGMSLSPTWLSGEAWRRPDSGVNNLFSPEFYVDIAQRAEAAKLDFVFRPDTLFLNPAALETGPGFASLDPTLLLAAIAKETSHIGLLSTVSTTFLPPYVVARQLMSLHWLSGGRAGWNIVTALDGNRNFGQQHMPPADQRYARAAEFTEVVRALWDSFPNDALRIDRAAGRFADPAQVQPINHQGAHFTVEGPLNLPSYKDARVPLVQAGASGPGRDFAASVSDAIFASTPDMQAAIDLRKDLRDRAAGIGRSAGDIRLLPGLSLYLAPTRKEARELFLDTHARNTRAQRIANVLAMTGLDLTEWPGDRPITAKDLPPAPENPRSRTHSNLLRRMIERDAPTPDALLERPEVIGSAHWQVIGTVGDAVDAIRQWAEAGAIDGFVCVPGGSVTSMHLSLDEVIPALSDLGLFRRDYTATTLLGLLTEE
ncbi:NtaA/DmoA family FMN-dependent monooxygenase [Actibacterium lipolyticum]|uniref:Putative monooxygenase MoxC n=1 Tax=Actibacterium lipolyticum TaxID=1524263 RepID=A0A238L7T0_9RHOB|nr:NtaA/DmoA family FMN-dependent monooxygenase [Actibacterium lipolyticum]SMX51068.1 Putative monooxygenase MoxC [Actibacterium lipolyticum]